MADVDAVGAQVLAEVFLMKAFHALAVVSVPTGGSAGKASRAVEDDRVAGSQGRQDASSGGA